MDYRLAFWRSSTNELRTGRLVTARISASAAATAATTTEAAATTAAIFARSHRTSFVDRHCAAFVVCTVELRDRVLSFSVRRHFDETKAFAAAGVTVSDDLRGLNGSALSESISQRLIGCGERQI